MRPDLTGQDRTRPEQPDGPDVTGQDRTRQEKTGQDRPVRPDATGHSRTGSDRTGPDRKGQAGKTGYDRTEPNRTNLGDRACRGAGRTELESRIGRPDKQIGGQGRNGPTPDRTVDQRVETLLGL